MAFRLHIRTLVMALVAWLASFAGIGCADAFATEHEHVAEVSEGAHSCQALRHVCMLDVWGAGDARSRIETPRAVLGVPVRRYTVELAIPVLTFFPEPHRDEDAALPHAAPHELLESVVLRV